MQRPLRQYSVKANIVFVIVSLGLLLGGPIALTEIFGQGEQMCPAADAEVLNGDRVDCVPTQPIVDLSNTRVEVRSYSVNDTEATIRLDASLLNVPVEASNMYFAFQTKAGHYLTTDLPYKLDPRSYTLDDLVLRTGDSVNHDTKLVLLLATDAAAAELSKTRDQGGFVTIATPLPPGVHAIPSDRDIFVPAFRG